VVQQSTPPFRLLPGDESAKRAGKWQCCALLYYDMMMEYTYGNGKPEADKDFNTLNRYE